MILCFFRSGCAALQWTMLFFTQCCFPQQVTLDSSEECYFHSSVISCASCAGLQWTVLFSTQCYFPQQDVLDSNEWSCFPQCYFSQEVMLDSSEQFVFHTLLISSASYAGLQWAMLFSTQCYFHQEVILDSSEQCCFPSQVVLDSSEKCCFPHEVVLGPSEQCCFSHEVVFPIKSCRTPVSSVIFHMKLFFPSGCAWHQSDVWADALPGRADPGAVQTLPRLSQKPHLIHPPASRWQCLLCCLNTGKTQVLG